MRLKILFILLLAAGQAVAAPVTWTLDGLTFDGGDPGNPGPITGSFVYDADTNTYSDISILSDWYGELTFTGENNLYPSYFSPPALDAPLTDFSDTGMTLAGTMGWCSIAGCIQKELTLVFDTALTNAGGTVGLVSGVSNERVYTNMGEGLLNSRTLVSGVITTVPIPAAVWLFGSALAGLGWLRRKQAA